jgi:hypothetical protein
MYEHIGQFLAQVNDMGITDVHKIRMFALSLTGAASNWFTSLPPNSIDSWVSLEQKFHDYYHTRFKKQARCTHMYATIHT